MLYKILSAAFINKKDSGIMGVPFKVQLDFLAGTNLKKKQNLNCSKIEQIHEVPLLQ